MIEALLVRFCSYPIHFVWLHLASQAAYEGSIPFARSKFIHRIRRADGRFTATSRITRIVLAPATVWCGGRAISRSHEAHADDVKQRRTHRVRQGDGERYPRVHLIAGR